MNEHYICIIDKVEGMFLDVIIPLSEGIYNNRQKFYWMGIRFYLNNYLDFQFIFKH